MSKCLGRGIAQMAGVLLLLAGVSLCQDVPGVQMFSTNEFGVDLATGNVNIQFPLRSKIGKIPFWSQVVGTSGVTNVQNMWALFPSWTYQDPTTLTFGATVKS